MVSFTSALVLLTTLAATATHVAAYPDGLLHGLIARQTLDPSSFPQQCEDQCSSLLSLLNDPSCSADLQCICGKDFSSKMLVCTQCDATIVGQDAAADLYQNYADACKSGGITVPSFSGSSSGGSSGGNAGSNSGNKGSDGAYSNLQMSAAGVVGSAALAFMLAA